MYSLDFDNAFLQAKLTRPVYMHIPRGFKATKPGNRCLKMIKSIYGMADSPLTFAKFLFENLRKLGMKQSENDQCLWFSPDLIVICYCDDLCVAARTPETYQKFIKDLRSNGMVLTDEGSFAEY